MDMAKLLRKDAIVLENKIARECPLCHNESEHNVTFRCYPDLIFLTLCRDCIIDAHKKLRVSDETEVSQDNLDFNCF
jgi:hypothetical protein